MSGGKSAAAGKARSKKARGLEEPEGNGHAGGNGKAPPTADALREQLAAAEKEREKAETWGGMRGKRLEDAEARVATLTQQLAAAEVRDLPLPESITRRITFKETDVPVAAIREVGNHREHVDDAENMRLARTLKVLGLQQRIGVRESAPGEYELIWGSRRLAATKLNGDTQIAAKVYPKGLTAAEVEILRTIENFGKKDLSHVERALAVARTIDAIGNTLAPLENRHPRGVGSFDPDFQREMAESIDIDEAFGNDPPMLAAARLSREILRAGGLEAYVGIHLGFSARWVKDNNYVSKLGGEARALLAAGRIDVGHARELAKLGDKERADEIARMVARNDQGLGGSSIEQTRNLVVQSLRSLRVVPWRLDVAFGRDDKAGCAGNACANCPHNSRSDPDLFGGTVAEEPAAGFCTNGACFELKQSTAEKMLADFAKKAQAEVKRHDLDVTERGLAHLIPHQLKASSAVRRAQKVIKPKPKAARPEGSSRGGYQRTPEQLAKDKHEEASRKWRDKAEPLLIKAILADPGRFAALSVLCRVQPFSALYDSDDEKVAAAQDLIDLAIAGDVKALAARAVKEQAKVTDRWRRNIPMYDDSSSDLVTEALAKGWGVEVPPRPKLEEFLPKTAHEPQTIPLNDICKLHPKKKGKKTAGDHAAAAEHHKQLKGKKKPTVLPPAGDEEDEDAELAGVGADDEED